MKHLVAYIGPALVIALAIPMALGKVPPNGLYGFKTEKTLASREVWYAANRVAGWLMVGAGLLTIAVNLVIWTQTQWPMKTQVLWMANTLPMFLIPAVLGALAYIRRL